jgi:hypothetical protein
LTSLFTDNCYLILYNTPVVQAKLYLMHQQLHSTIIAPICRGKLLALDLGLPARFFVTRDKGEQAFARLAAALPAVPEEGSLILQFPAGQVMDVSFADEAVIQLGQAIVDGKYGRRRLLLAGLTQGSVDNINAAIRLQRLKLDFLAIAPGGQWQVVGHLEDNLQETLTMVAQRPSL